MVWYEFLLLAVFVLSFLVILGCITLQEIRTYEKRRAFMDKLVDRLDLIAFHLQQIAKK